MQLKTTGKLKTGKVREAFYEAIATLVEQREGRKIHSIYLNADNKQQNELYAIQIVFDKRDIE